MLVRDRELARRAEHAVRHLPTERLRAEGLIEHRDPAAGLGPGDEIARGHVPDADHDLDRSVSVVHGREAELVGVRVVADLEHPRHHHPLQSGPGSLDPLDLDPAGVDPLCEGLHVHLDGDELPQP